MSKTCSTVVVEVEVGVHVDVKVGDIVFALADDSCSEWSEGQQPVSLTQWKKCTFKETGAFINSTRMRIINTLQEYWRLLFNRS